MSFGPAFTEPGGHTPLEEGIELPIWREGGGLKLFVIRCLRGNKFVRNLVAFQGLVVDIRRGLISCFGLVVRGSS